MQEHIFTNHFNVYLSKHIQEITCNLNIFRETLLQSKHLSRDTFVIVRSQRLTP